MNLYLVTCCGTYENLDVYVVASNFVSAETLALNLMVKLRYPYTDRVGNIEFIASVNTYKAKHLLVWG
jgi:hypothetical protein